MKSSFCRLVPRVAFGLLVLFLFSSSASATSFVIPTDRELIAKADAIVRGVVMSRRVVQSDTGVIVTLYELAVTRSLKGDVKQGSFITVRTAGGHLGDRFLLVESAAHFSENDDVLLFLTSEDDGWTTTDMALGKFRPALTNRGYSVLIRDSDELSGRTRALVRKVRLESAFMRFIGDTVRGREPRESYEVDAAEAIAPSPDGGGWNVRGDARFPASTYSMAAGACEDEGSAVRWPTAVMNAGVEWFKNEANDLSGARGGGVGVIQSGLAAWTRDGGSAIDAQYAGTTRRLAGNDSQNTIVFDDPQNLIAGRWTGSGVIATTFVYGAGSHTFDGQTFLDVIDADIVFQDGYTASERTVEETITHEVGHAVGIRHSNGHFAAACSSGCAERCSEAACDPAVEACATSSIMNGEVTDSIGFVLQPWDSRAASALYPAALAIPAAPTNVVALSTGSTAVFVSWSGVDGATSYTVWRTEGGPYTFLGEPVPNPAATSFLDETASPNHGYIYQVQAHNASGSSPLSGGDIATTVVYTDPTLTAGMPIKAVHLTELRTAANLMRALTGSTVVPTYTDPTIGAGSTKAKAVHFQEVEAVLIAARTSLGLSTPAALGIVAGTPIPAAHITALRSYAQ